MQRIADEAGVGKRAVVSSYKSREGLLDAVIRHVGDRMLNELEEAVAGMRIRPRSCRAGSRWSGVRSRRTERFSRRVSDCMPSR